MVEEYVGSNEEVFPFGAFALILEPKAIIDSKIYNYLDNNTLMDFSLVLNQGKNPTKLSGFHLCNQSDVDLYYASVEESWDFTKLVGSQINNK